MLNKKITISAVCFIATLSFSSAATWAQDADTMEAIAACSRISDNDERTACYDELAQRTLAEESAVEQSAAPAAEAAAEPAVEAAAVVPAAAASAEEAAPEPVQEPAPEDNLVLAETEDPKKKPIYGHVRKCQETSDRRWFFILDSGDVWKQSGGKTRRFSDCDFDVVFRKDFFGYKMHIDGDEEPVRVRLHK